VQHVTFERNRTYGEPSIQVDLMIWARDVIVRNNIFDGTGGGPYFTAITVGQRGIEPASANVRILNNTIYKQSAGSEFYGVVVQSPCQNVTVRNNFASAVSASTKGMISGSCTGFVQDHNLLTIAPLFVNPAAGDFSLQAGSPALGAGVTLPEIREDFWRIARPLSGPSDLGACERP